MQKLSVEQAELKNGVFTCECWIGDEETTERRVLFDELVRSMNGSDGMIPVNDDDPELDEYHMPLIDWIAQNDSFELHWALSQLINKKEGRTEFVPSCSMDHDFLPTMQLLNLLGVHAA